MARKAQSFEDLQVWQKAHMLVLKTYRVTKEFPADEKFGLVSQMRRAGVSVAANIVEGFKKRGVRDKSNFYNISEASLEELRYFIILSKDLGYINGTEEWNKELDEVAKMLTGLIRSVKDNYMQ